MDGSRWARACMVGVPRSQGSRPGLRMDGPLAGRGAWGGGRDRVRDRVRVRIRVRIRVRVGICADSCGL